MPGVAVDHRTGGEEVVVPLPIERLLDAAIILLALDVVLPVLHEDPLTLL